jgi:hypothetical protein
MSRNGKANARATIVKLHHKSHTQADLTGLESDIFSAIKMAYIATELLEHNLGHSHQDVTGHPEKYHLGKDDVDAMLFAVYETHQMLEKLRDKYLNALKLEH